MSIRGHMHSQYGNPMEHDLHVVSHVSGAPKWTIKGGRKSQPSSIVPGPGSYQIEGENGAKFKRNKGYTWGHQSRGSQMQSSNLGPGAYDPQLHMSRPGSVRGFGPQAPRSIASAGGHKNYAPGPGSYDVPTSFGKAPRYSAGGKRETKPQFRAPGPGAYNPDDHLSSNKTVRGVASTKSIAPMFSRCRRDVGGFPSDTPGPGAYNADTNGASTQERGPAYSMRSSRRYLNSRESATPGPGAHDCLYTQFI